MTDNFVERMVETDQEFINLALSYGNFVRSRSESEILETITSRHSAQADKDSLTRRYGLNEFPIHTDCAYLRLPPKYVFLRYIGTANNPTPTILVHFEKSNLSDEELDFVTRTMWFVKSTNGGFYSTIYKNDILRYDKEVMKIVNSAENKMESLLAKMKTSKIEWVKNKVIIIDNHQTLHYRPKVSDIESGKRILQRINIL